MGALTTLTKWIPEDDLLLKNAVEAGASLESLAKGAVRFSRRYTIRELQDRWRSLLYDLETSIEASAQILQLEVDSVSNLPKASRVSNSSFKGKELSSGKRKADTVRSHYYAMRKRIRSEPSAVNLSNLAPPTSNYFTECNDGFKDQLLPCSKQLADGFAPEIPISNDIRHPEVGYHNGDHAAAEFMRVNSAAANGHGNFCHQSYHAGHVGSVKHILPGRVSCEGDLFGYGENISQQQCNEAVCNSGNQSFEHDFQQRDFPHILGENLISVDNPSDVHEISQSKALPTSSQLKNDDIDVEPASNNNNNNEEFCSNFTVDNNLSSHDPNCGSFHQLGYSSPPSAIPIWRTMEDAPISTPTMPMDGRYGDRNQGLLDMDDEKNVNAPGCNVPSSELNLGDEMQSDFMDMADGYMDFADEEDLLFIDVEGKENTDRSCLGLSSVLLSSPADTHQDTADPIDLGGKDVPETCLETASSGQPVVIFDQMHSGICNDPNTTTADAKMPSISPQILMLCVLNTEDLEIPNNDHIKFPTGAVSLFSSKLEQCTRESKPIVTSINELPSNIKEPGCLNTVKEQTKSKQSVPHLKATPLSIPGAGVICDGSSAETESSKGGTITECFKHAGGSADEPKPSKLDTGIVLSLPATASNDQSRPLYYHNQDNPDTSFASFLETHLQDAEDVNHHPLDRTDSCQEEANMQAAQHTCLPSPNLETEFPRRVAVASASDQNQQFSDIDDDVPYFSDIEALILDMDLSPYDEESCLPSKEVLRSQNMDIRSTVRWEQGLNSRTNRSISSHGAFAIFYGRHLKYYIKESEVSVGRETEDFKVDIDLGREGRANKISRLQAIIKMDGEGSFSLKNFGKFSIFVNGKEVPAKKRINVLSHSLIKIQEMHFMFEVNESAVRRHVKKLRQSQEQSVYRFDVKPEPNH